jgi:hypothetical protein
MAVLIGSKIPGNALHNPEISRQGGTFRVILKNCIYSIRIEISGWLGALFQDSLKSTWPWQEILGNEPKNLKMSLDISGLKRKVPGYVLLQLPWKIPPQAGFGPAAQPPWPGILRNHFCSAVVLPLLSCASCPVLAVLSWLSCPGCPFKPDQSRLTFPG